MLSLGLFPVTQKRHEWVLLPIFRESKTFLSVLWKQKLFLVLCDHWVLSPLFIFYNSFSTLRWLPLGMTVFSWQFKKDSLQICRFFFFFSAFSSPALWLKKKLRCLNLCGFYLPLRKSALLFLGSGDLCNAVTGAIRVSFVYLFIQITVLCCLMYSVL